MYEVSENTIVSINTGKSWHDDNIIYPIRNHKLDKKYCSECGVQLKTSQAKLCPICSAKSKRKTERPDKEQLQKELYEVSGNFTELARKYKVTDNAIRKWCKAYDLPSHSKDYKPIKKSKEGKISLPVQVQKIDEKTGEVIAIFDSINQAEKQTGIYHIFQASDPNNTSRKTAGGFIWKRV
jgi:hypothetical protein